MVLWIDQIASSNYEEMGGNYGGGEMFYTLQHLARFLIFQMSSESTVMKDSLFALYFLISEEL